MLRRNPSTIIVEDSYIYVIANNTGRKHKFDYSPELLEKLTGKGWYEATGGYLSANVKGKTFRAYWFVTGIPPKGIYVDHINRDVTDNTQENLRFASPSMNGANHPKNKNGVTSIYKGVHWAKHAKKWRARIEKDWRHIHVGYFNSPEDAARAYDSMAVKLFGEFAATNQSMGLL